MFQYCHDDLSELRTDAVVIEVDCAGTANGNQWSQLKSIYPDVTAAYRKAFTAGDIEPGRVLRIARTDQTPAHAFVFPSRVHPHGAVRREYIEKGIDDVTEQMLRVGAKSVAIGRMGSDRGMAWSEIKRQWLYSFARVPEIKLFGMLSRSTIAAPVTIFTDGSAEPNRGQGGYGVVLRFGDHSKELSDGFRNTSSNRMELMAAVAGLEALKQPCRVHLHSDSRYVTDMVNQGTLFRIAAKNWGQRKTKNLDLWKRFLDAFLVHDVDMAWVKGHAGINDNERCDQLAARAVKQEHLKIDVGYYQNTTKLKPSKASTTSHPAKRSTAASSHVASKDNKPAAKPRKTGDPCRNCGTPLVRREVKKHKADAAYHFSWYLYCENCRRMYHVEEAKVIRESSKL